MRSFEATLRKPKLLLLDERPPRGRYGLDFAATSIIAIDRRIGRRDLSTQDATFVGQRVWLEGDVRAYVSGEAVPDREENAFQHLYMDLYEVAAALKMDPASLANKHFVGPAPAGYVSGRKYWLRSEVDNWVRDNADRIQRRLARRGSRARSVAE